MRIALVVLAAALPLLSGCISRDQVAESRSADGALEARLIETNGGVLTSFGYEVEVRLSHTLWPGWRRAANFYGAYRSDCAYGVNLAWRDNRTLEISYAYAEQAHAARGLDLAGGHSVRIVTRPDVEDPSAACGRMLYNLQGRPYG